MLSKIRHKFSLRKKFKKELELSVIFNDLLRKKFIRNVITVATGTAMAQVIVLAFSPLITRIYGPEVYGVFGVFTSLLGIFLPITALTYPVAIVLPKNDIDARGLVKLSLYATAAMSAFVGILLILWGKPIAEILHVEVLIPYLLIFPIMMIFDGIFQVVQQWLIREKRFKVKAKVAVKQSLIVNSLHSGFGLLYPTASTLIIIATLGKGLYAFMLAWGAGIRLNTKKIFRMIKKEESLSVFALAKRYIDFPKYRAVQVFINGISESLPVLLLATFFGPAVAGFYSIGMRVLAAPTQLIGNAVGDVFYPRISEAAHKGENVSKLLLKANSILMIVGLIPFGVIIISGPWLFGFVFGDQWLHAGVYARWLAVGSYFTFITRPTIKALLVLEEQRFHLNFTIVTILARLGALIIGGYILSNDVMAVALYSIVGAILYTILALMTIIKSKLHVFK